MGLFLHWKHTVLLCAMLSLVFLRALTAGVSGASPLIELAGGLVVLLTVISSREVPRLQRAVILLSIPAIGFAFATGRVPLEHSGLVFALARASMALFLGVTLLTIVRSLLSCPLVTLDSLAGAFAGYLLIGTAWTDLYGWVALVNPGAFGGSSGGMSPLTDSEWRWHELQYFSFATLTTLGYGDVVPVSPFARILACLEAICGQLYLAVLVAGLVGMRFSQKAK